MVKADMRKDPDQPRQWRFDIVLADGFVLTELSAIVDVLRIANRICGKPPFAWTFRSKNGGKIESSAGASIETEPCTDMPDADYTFFIGNSDPDNPALSAGTCIRAYTYRGAKVFLLAEAASRYISEYKGDAHPFTTHWENLAFMRERDMEFDASDLIASEKDGIVTCAGMTATTDVVLSIIAQHISPVEKSTIADIMLIDQVRDPATRQIVHDRSAIRSGDELVNDAIRQMRSSLEIPIPMRILAHGLGLSLRSLERRFRRAVGKSPNKYYRELRLKHANNLLLNTSMSIQEIGIACGYPKGFTKQFRESHGITPSELRRAYAHSAPRAQVRSEIITE
ncbi:MAG: helix-turn-helix domain-containing protein [Thalassovita sp.]|nr:helix-turn-helix domain-containing protein [Thalassovita sp.]